MLRSKLGRVCATLLAAVAAFSLAGCSFLSDIEELILPTSVTEARDAARDETSQAVSDSLLVESGTLTVGILSTESVPLSITSSDGTLTGIDVEIAYALADELGLYSVEFVSVTSVELGLESCDVVMGVTSDDGVTVLGNYAQSALGVFSTDGTTATADELVSGTVGVQSGSVSEQAASEIGVTTTSTYSNLNEAFEALEAGEVDYVICDSYAGAYLACSYDDISFAGLIDSPETVGVAVSSDSDELHDAVLDAIENLEYNGIADVIRSRWIGESESLTEDDVISGLTTTESTETDETSDTTTEDVSSDAESGTDTATDETSAE